MLLLGLKSRVTQRWYELLGYGASGRDMDIHPDDVFLVGYPKSGNTWLDFLVACLLVVSDSQDVDFFSVERFVADIYYNNAKNLKNLTSPRHFKSHEPYDSRYGRMVYIVRDPRDVAVSYYYHHIKLKMLKDGADISTFVQRFVQGELDGFGSWGEHVMGWLDQRENDKSFLLVRYEDLKCDTVAGLGRLAVHMGLHCTDERLRATVSWCSPENMKQLERKQQSTHPTLKNTRKDMPFVRKASTGGWRRALSEADVRCIEQAWHPVMLKLGYLT